MRSISRFGTSIGLLSLLSLFAFPLASPSRSHAETTATTSAAVLDLKRAPVPRLEPGIVIGEHQESGYSDVVTVVLPRLSSGHVESLPDYSKRYASMFKFVVLANIVQDRTPAGTQHRMDKVGIGMAMEIDGKMTVVTSSTANQFGADLGMIDRGVLGGNEDCLEEIFQIARTDRLIVFDAKANMVVGDDHEERIMRHFLWVSANTGKLGMLVWLLKDVEDTNYLVDSSEMQLILPAFEEDRRIHVSEGGFFSSKIPTPDRFALVSLPQGTPVPFSATMKSVAGEASLTRDELQKFVDAAGASIERLRTHHVSRKEP